jgi:signal transduction histidine kinase
MKILLALLGVVFAFVSLPSTEMVRAKALYDSTEMVLSRRGDYKMAEDLLAKAQNESFSTDLKMLVTFALRGQIEGYRSNYYNSDFYLFEALKYAEKVKEDYFISEIAHALAINKRQEGDLEDAVVFYKKAIAHADKDAKSPRLALLYNNYGLAFLHQNRLDSAEYMFKRSYDLSEKAGYVAGKGYYFSNMGSIRLKQKRYTEALQNFEQGMGIFSSVNGPLALIKKEMAECYVALGNMRLAETLLDDAIQGIQQFENKKVLRDCYQLRLRILESTGRENQTSEVLKNLLSVERDIANQDNELKLKSAEYGYKLNLQEEQNRTQRLEIEVRKQQNILLIAGVAVVTGLSLVFVLLFLHTRSKSRTIRKQAEELDRFNQVLEVRIAERTAELSQVNTSLALKNKEISQALLDGKVQERQRLASDLHDNLGGLIAGLKWSFAAFSPKNDKEKEVHERIESMLSDAYDNVRNLSHNLIPRELQEEGLVAGLENLIERLNDNPRILFVFKHKVEARLHQNVEFELYGALMELLTNTTKHSDADRVELSLVQGEGKVTIHLIDNGSEIKWEGNGMGGQTVRDRIENHLKGNLNYTRSEGHNYFKITIPDTRR